METTYTAIFLMGMLAAAILGRWTTKNLLIFMFCVATLVAVARAVSANIGYCVSC